MTRESAETTPAAQYEFGPFRLEAATRSLYRAGAFVPLTPKAAEILVLLVQEAGRVVTKEMLLERVWTGVIVEEGTIANNISALRKVLDTGDFGAEGPIATVQRRGYRFTAPVIPAEAGTQSPVPVIPAKAEIQSPDRATVFVADIENKTGDAVFDGTIRQALLLLLAQSSWLDIVGDRKVHTVLGYMGKPGAALTGDVAFEVAQRTGSSALITGSIFAFGDEYMIGLQAVQSDNGAILLSEQARAHGKGEVLKALDAAAVGLRTKLGESLPSVQASRRDFDEVVTSSLDALKAYAMGRQQWMARGDAAAKAHFLRAIQLDPHFSSAYAALAHICNNMGQTQDSVAYMRKAYELLDHAMERERVRIEATYHNLVTGDLFKSYDAHVVWQQSFPRDAVAFGNAGDVLMMMGHWEKAHAAFQRTHVLEPSPMSVTNLAIALMVLGRHEEARALLDDGFARGYDVFFLHLDAYHEAFLRGDSASMLRHANAAMGRPTEEDFLLAAQADTEAYHGRFIRARELSRRAIESARDAGGLEMASVWEAESALREAEIGELERARAGALTALETYAGRETRCIAALVLARCGEAKVVKELVAQLDADHPQSTVVQRYWLPCIRAAMAIDAKDWKAALDSLEPAHPVEFALNKPFEGGLMIPPYLRGLALLGAGRGEDAAAELMKIVERPGLIKNFVIYPLAHLHAARAGQADAPRLRARLEEIWSEADISVTETRWP